MSRKIRDKYLEMMEKFQNFPYEYKLKIDTQIKAPIFIAISEDKKPLFLFDVSETMSDYVSILHDTSGYNIIKQKLSEGFIRVGIKAMEEKCFDVFYIVVEDLIDTICNQTDCVSITIIKRLLMWEDFFKNAHNGVLAYTEQVGLLGELLFIEEELRKGHKEIIDNWKGPEKSVKDFVINSVAVEIKTMNVTATNRIHISDENQLDSSGFSALYLNVRIIAQNQMDGRALPEVVDSINFYIDDDISKKHVFDEKLLHIGFKDSLREKYEYKFELSDSYWYKVEDTIEKFFPRITPSDLKFGIKFVKYEIELSTLQPFLVNSEQAVNSWR